MGLWQERDGLEVYIPEAEPIRIWPGMRHLPHPPGDPPEIPGLPSLPTPPERPSGWTYVPWFLMSALYGLIGPLAFGRWSWAYLLFIPLTAATSVLAGGIQYRWAARRYRQQAAEGMQRAERRLHRFLSALERWRRQEEALEQAMFPRWEELVQRLQAGTDLWFRHRGDPDFLTVSAGRRRVPLVPPGHLRNLPDPEEIPGPLQGLGRTVWGALHAEIERPLPLALRASTVLMVFPGQEGALARILLELALTHSPGEVAIAVGLRDPRWAFLRWLPHVGELREGYAGGAVRIREEIFALFYQRRNQGEMGNQAVVALGDEDWLMDPRLGDLLRKGPAMGVYPVLIVPPGVPTPGGIGTLAVWRPDGSIRLLNLEGGQVVEGMDAGPLLSWREAEQVARQLSRLRPMGVSEGPAVRPALGLWGLDPDDPEAWRGSLEALRQPRSGLAVPIGYADDGTPFLLDLHDRGHGPHAMVIGTTGSGKSEAMRTLALALALSFPPDRVQLLFIDFKGGGAFAPLRSLPHCAGLLSNLDAREAARALETLESELDRRQRVLAQKGADHADAGGLPHLVVMADEFAEMLEQIPDGMGRMIRLARLGRSLGLHLVLATQRLGGAVPGELRANLRVRIALRCETPEESTAVLGRPDAAYLPGSGWAFIQVGQNEVFQRIRFGYVSGFSVGMREEIWMDPADATRERRLRRSGGDTQRDLDRLVALLEAVDPPIPPLTPPPLPSDPGAPEGEDRNRIGIGVADFPETGALRWVFCDGAVSDLSLIGQARTGKTWALRAMGAAAARAGRRVWVVDGRGEWEDAAWATRIDPSDREGVERMFQLLSKEAEPALLVMDGLDEFGDEARMLLEDRLGAVGRRPDLWIWTAARREVRLRPLRGRPSHRVVLGLEPQEWETLVGRFSVPEAAFQGRWWGEGRWREIRLRQQPGDAPPAPPLPRAPYGAWSALPPPVRGRDGGGVELTLGWNDRELEPSVIRLDRRRPALGLTPEVAWGQGVLLALVRKFREAGWRALPWDPEGLLEDEAEERPEAFLEQAAELEEGAGGVVVIANTDAFRMRMGYHLEIPPELRRPSRLIWLWAGRDALGLRGWRLLPAPEESRVPPISAGHPGLAWLSETGGGRWIILPVSP